MKALIVLNHNPVEGVYEHLKKLGVEKVDLLKDVNPELAKKVANVPFDIDELLSIVKELHDLIAGDEFIVYDKDKVNYNVVVIAGEPRLIYNLIVSFEEPAPDYGCWSSLTGAVKFYTPYSERISEDIKQPDGSIKKVSKFIYKGLAEY